MVVTTAIQPTVMVWVAAMDTVWAMVTDMVWVTDITGKFWTKQNKTTSFLFQ